MLGDGSNTFTWNARNQVAKLNGISLQYDAFGRRIQNAAGTSFLYDGANAVQELSGSTVSANLLGGGIDEIFSRADSAGAYGQLKEALGSTIGLVDSNGILTTSYTYAPFGGTSIAGTSNANTLEYAGRENEGNGLYFYRARYYNPQSGRFISEDPSGLLFGPNLYQYAYDSPTNLIDPSGLWPSSGTVSIGGTVNIRLGPINLQYSGGFVVDVRGNVGVYNTYTPVPGGSFPSGDVSNVGNYGGSGYPYDFPQARPGSTPVSNWGLGLGLSLAGSNGRSICSLGGPFISGSAGGGEGVTITGDGFGGTDSQGRVVVGGGTTVGTGLGSGAISSVNVTNTVITALAGRKSSCQ